jgi:NAD(P)-dependent dehydrogenase (short-subunit alcohol dehydrogenase family)
MCLYGQKRLIRSGSHDDFLHVRELINQERVKVMTITQMDKKIALITGANKGIGFEIARQLAQLGYKVLIGARDPQRGEEAAKTLQTEGLDAAFIHIDVTDQETIDSSAKKIGKEYGKLDVLVNNAAIAQDNVPPSQLDMEILRRTYETNVFGLFAVTKAMIPLLLKSEAGRIVNMSSGAGLFKETSSPGWRPEWNSIAYSTSKSAVNAMTIQFALELRGTNIKVNAVNPGYTLTDMSPEGERTVEQGAIAPVRLATLPANGPTGVFFDENGLVPW